MRDLAGRVAIVTGASSGIGAATAVAFGRAGLRVALAARRQELLEQVAAQVRAAGGEALVLAADLRDPAAGEALVAATTQAWGRVDVMVANAGLGRGGRFERIPEESLLEQVEVNLVAVVRCARAVLPGMLAQGSGHLIAVSSVAGELGIPYNVIYSATKAAVTNLCEGLGREVGRRGVAVTAVLPGFIATPMTAGDRFPVRLPGPEIVAEAILRALRRPRRRVVVPGYYRLVGGLNHWFPGLVGWGIGRVVPKYGANGKQRPDA